MYNIYAWLPNGEPTDTGVGHEDFAEATAQVISFAQGALRTATKKSLISAEVIEGDLIVRVYETQSSELTHRWIVRKD